MRSLYKQLALGVVTAAMAIGSGAQAQDSGRPGLWQGFYLGANVGFGTTTVSSVIGTGSTDLKGAVGGVHGGYNWQSGAFVAGVEADYDFSGLKRSDTLLGVTARMSVDSLASVRGRAGYAFDRALIFATVGYAWTPGTAEVSLSGASTSVSATNTGIVFGGGAEYKFTPNLSLRGEVLRYNTSADWTVGKTTLNIDSKSTVFRGGVSYHF